MQPQLQRSTLHEQFKRLQKTRYIVGPRTALWPYGPVQSYALETPIQSIRPARGSAGRPQCRCSLRATVAPRPTPALSPQHCLVPRQTAGAEPGALRPPANPNRSNRSMAPVARPSLGLKRRSNLASLAVAKFQERSLDLIFEGDLHLNKKCELMGKAGNKSTSSPEEMGSSNTSPCSTCLKSQAHVNHPTGVANFATSHR